MIESKAETVKPRPPVLRALGKLDPPLRILVEGQDYERIDTCKHDSWAATAIYQSLQTGEKIVCKFNRQQAIFGIPMKWLGRFLARREGRFYQLFSDVSYIPNGCDQVYVDGKLCNHAVAHCYIEGHPLGIQEYIPDEFFPKLQTLLNQVHQRGVAYVDLHKRENIIIGQDGNPYLIDFQVAFSIRASNRNRICRWFLSQIQAADHYHLMKHQVYYRPDLYGSDIKAAVKLRPWWLNIHRSIAPMLRAMRRRLLTVLRIRNRTGMAESEWFAEDAFRVRA